MSIEYLRKKIEETDESLARLFVERMAISAEIAEYKKANGLPVYDSARERALLDKNTAGMTGGNELYGRIFFRTLMELSRSLQNRLIAGQRELNGRIEASARETPALFPEKAVVACQGTEGAYSQYAAERLFVQPSVTYFKSFDGVISAVSAGLCRYGLLPIENSTAGSVNRIYDLISGSSVYIVRALKLKIDHSLLANNGAELKDIKEVYSHQQALSQCAGFLREAGIKAVPSGNTAEAAEMVRKSGRTDIAALASRACAGLYGLRVLKSAVQDRENNYTRFICVSKNIELYPGADKTSLLLTLPHKAGALYGVISRLYALGVNLVKLESRPIPEKDFEFMFYFDVECPVYSPVFPLLINEMEDCAESFKYLGTYSELI